MEGISHNMRTKFPVSNGLGCKDVSIISSVLPAFSSDGWEYYCKKMDEKAATRASRAAKFIEDGINAGVYTIVDDKVTVKDDRLTVAFFAMCHGDPGHRGELYYAAHKFFDWVKNVISEPKKAKNALEAWLTDNYRRFVLKSEFLWIVKKNI